MNLISEFPPRHSRPVPFLFDSSYLSALHRRRSVLHTQRRWDYRLTKLTRIDKRNCWSKSFLSSFLKRCSSHRFDRKKQPSCFLETFIYASLVAPEWRAIGPDFENSASGYLGLGSDFLALCGVYSFHEMWTFTTVARGNSARILAKSCPLQSNLRYVLRSKRKCRIMSSISQQVQTEGLRIRTHFL